MTRRIGIAYGVLAALSLAAAWVPQQDVQKERLRIALKDYELGGKWIYDDIQKGFSEAQRTGKPLLVAFR